MMDKAASLLMIIALSPFLFGVINRTKAFFAGRQGSPLGQLYYDLFKLMHKGAVYSVSTTWLIGAGPVISLAALMTAGMLIPFAGRPALVSFDGDVVVFIYLLGLARFFTVLAALDTGSSFEGMGASREVQFALFAEPALFISVAALARVTGTTSLSGIYTILPVSTWLVENPGLLLVVGAFLIIFLAENCRIPVDDPNTHLELTMIHEVMILDHGGPDLALILWGAAVKFWLLGTLIVGMFVGPRTGTWVGDAGISLLGMLFLAVAVGIIESVLARLRLLKVPHLLIVAIALAALSLTLTLRT